jgi:two-component system, response regulator
MTAPKPVTMLIAEDDPDDRMLVREAFDDARLLNDLHFVVDGVDLFDYLYRRGKYDKENAPRPGIILLDLNMPRMDGREVIERLKEDTELRKIPVVVLTTSKAEEDLLRSYDLGVSGFIVKPVMFEALVSVIKGIAQYWFHIVELPHSED